MTSISCEAAPAARPAVRFDPERIISVVLVLLALTALTALAVITIFIFKEGVPIILKVGLGKFIFSSDWRPRKGAFGIFPMIVGLAGGDGRGDGHRRRLRAGLRHPADAVLPAAAGGASSSRASSCWPASPRWSTGSSAW